jgi:GT2 family glycosyltransferase
VDTFSAVPSTDAASPPQVAVVVLTMGDRPHELATALGSALAQDGVDVQLIVVGNGVPTDRLALPADGRITAVDVASNAGIPEGRNIGAAHARASLIAFLDDDATFLHGDVLSRSAADFARHARLGAVAFRIVDAAGVTARRHVPRIGSRRPDRPGAVTAFLGGACMLRAAAFEQVGGYAPEFGYAMEETDLALRLIDHGWDIRYDARPAVRHPATDPSRHPSAAERTMRNRVWLAHRNLPWPLAVLYVADWFAISGLRHPRHIAQLARGVVNGWRTRPGPRAPIRWRTVLRLTRLGRPPIV